MHARTTPTPWFPAAVALKHRSHETLVQLTRCLGVFFKRAEIRSRHPKTLTRCLHGIPAEISRYRIPANAWTFSLYPLESRKHDNTWVTSSRYNVYCDIYRLFACRYRDILTFWLQLLLFFFKWSLHNFFFFFGHVYVSAPPCFDFGLPGVLGIAFGGFLIGVLLVGALWFIKIKTGKWSSLLNE